MRHKLDRAASLILYTNAQLKGAGVEYTSEHSTIKFVEAVSRPAGGPKDAIFDDVKVLLEGSCPVDESTCFSWSVFHTICRKPKWMIPR